MLRSLRIKNYALLKDAKIDFDRGLNIITGETGAGKSIIIGALNICIGARGYTENIRSGEEKAEIEAVFELNDEWVRSVINGILEEAGINTSGDEIIIKREINRSSKGRVFINNCASSLLTLQKTGEYLIDIHGQHEHQSLLREEIHIDLLDSFSGTGVLRAEVTDTYKKLIETERRLAHIKKSGREKAEKLDLIKFRIKEIKEASIASPNELERLGEEREKLVHSAEIKETLNSILFHLSPVSLDGDGKGAIEMLEKAREAVLRISRFDSKMQEFEELLSEALVKVSEAKDFFSSYAFDFEFDPARLAETEEKISLLEGLIKKYKMETLGDVINYEKELNEELLEIESGEDNAEAAEKEVRLLRKKILELSRKLSRMRSEKSKELSDAVKKELKGLGINKAEFEPVVTEIKKGDSPGLEVEENGKTLIAGPYGIDRVVFMISLNPGEDLKPLAKIASGGEISRIMLAIKNILSESDGVPVMVFDEIDTGISGKIASITGRKMKEISEKKQLIVITHLPQIAAFSENHFSVGKTVSDGRTETLIKKLKTEEKEEEIASLLSGKGVTESSLKAARELISGA
ncbi:MAG TPA: DNA repair protein RecN [Firmicutes bacterium]|nr:DNA repair protein RecN [Bacillota bacterium]